MVIGVHRRRNGVIAQRFGQRRVVAQILVSKVKIDRIQTKAVHAALEPKLRHIQQSLLHGCVVQVQVGLARQEIVQVILLPPRVPLPGTAAKDRQPIVGRPAVALWLGPDIPIGFIVAAAFAAFLKPRMRRGRVRQHKINHHL